MTNLHTAYINGFIKKAQEYGLSEEQALSLAEQYNEKTSAVGLGLDLGLLGAPSAVGAGIGGNYSPISDKELQEQLAYSDSPSISKALKYLMVPGYTGYRHAKDARLDAAYEKYKADRRAAMEQGM